MKKNLRLLCLGLAAATFTAGFAQVENVTSKLKNADMEQGIKGWNVDGESHIFGKNTKNKAGFHGMRDGVLETWNGSGNGLGDNSISQTVRELPAGTYVFGAYIGASKQGSEESNRDIVTGVNLFANDAKVAVATDNPDRSDVKWGHSAKFNVAATVTEGASLNVGIDIKSTNANYAVWDNATLYYFGSMSEAEALNEMAKIDMAAVTAIADTCLAYKMNVDSLTLLTGCINAAKAIATADQLWQLDEDLRWALRKANASMTDYKNYGNVLKNAQNVLSREWPRAQDRLAALATAVEEAEAIYDNAEAARDLLNEKRAALREATALVEIDSMIDVRELVYEPFYLGLEIGEEAGQYSQLQYDALDALNNEVLSAYDAAKNGEMTAVEAFAYTQKMWDLMEEVKNNPNSVDTFPFTITASQTADADGRYKYHSKVYTVAFPVTSIRFTFKDVFCPNGAGKGNPPYVALGEFYLYDEFGDQIYLSADDFYTNAQEQSEGPIENLCDDDTNTFWHSDWHGNVQEYHYLEVTIPDGLDLTTFSFGWIDRGSNKQNIPLEVEVSSVSDAENDLGLAISTAKALNAYSGTDPGFYNADLTAFHNALAAAEALVGIGASDDDIYTAIAILEEETALVEEMEVNLPVEGKRYRIVSGDARFFEHQGVQKALTVRNDTLWWETVSPDKAEQEFVLEVMPNNDGANYYKLRNVATNLYVNTGDSLDYHPLFAQADTVELVAVGAGQFALRAHAVNVFHACDHNSGKLGVGWNGELEGAAGGLFGDYSRIIPYEESTLNSNNPSAWYIRELSVLPCAAKNLSDLNFQSEAIHLYTGVNTLTLTADKVSAFADLTVYGLLGEKLPSTVTVAGNVATVMLDTMAVESFSFTFGNSEGVTSVEVNGSLSDNAKIKKALEDLQRTLDAALANAPEEGPNVMQYANLSEFNAAVKTAETLLAAGGTYEAYVAAKEALDKAVAGLAELVPNAPDPDKAYFIVNALEAFEETHGVKMMLYAASSGPRWMYENVDKQNRLWKFELATQDELEALKVKNAAEVKAYYIKNVATNEYLGKVDGYYQALGMVSDKSATVPYSIVQLQGTIVALDGINKDGEVDATKRIHADGHGGGNNTSGGVVYYKAGVGSSSVWKICESNYYITDIDFTEMEGTDEYVAPAVKGIFDLFGRRIEAPAATGLYIVDGKKVLIK